MEVLIVVTASFFAGAIDAVVGGGGLILVPALFATFPTAHPATLFGTNKSASIWGTSFATLQYAKRVALDWKVLAFSAVCAFGGAFSGAWAVTQVDGEFLRKLLPFILGFVLIYTLAKKNFGNEHSPNQSYPKAVSIGFFMGWYDGFFGPGTGSFFIFLLIRYLGYDFLHASAAAKFLNVATNFAAILLFASHGHVWWQIGLMLAVANIAGSLVGSRLALTKGSGFVRQVFIFVVTMLIVKSGYDAYWG